ncbi:MAG: BlaI/MecI/CopY family transcriptional regulator [Peptococcaceae bacterium]|jgi:BlaI family penicillinase repressor|nr:BlaI/MecI/CopY family transcriptional regulator [Peptococcaceae bacterium]MDR2737106.1 BlaI/MecI/CopY family transcriptional regulator [Gracilibacteraceae bacterium]
MTIKISDAELEVMRILWREKRPMGFMELRTELEGKMTWSKSTIHTLIARLRDKGVISTQFQNVTLYSAAISENEYLQSFIDILFDGSAKNYIAALCRNGDLNEQDIDELKAFFDKEEDQ